MLLTRNEVWIKQVPHRPKRIDGRRGTKHKDCNINNFEVQCQGAAICVIYPTNQLKLAENDNSANEKSGDLKEIHIN